MEEYRLLDEKESKIVKDFCKNTLNINIDKITLDNRKNHNFAFTIKTKLANRLKEQGYV